MSVMMVHWSWVNRFNPRAESLCAKSLSTAIKPKAIARSQPRTRLQLAIVRIAPVDLFIGNALFSFI
jgi:hypothetical protein